MTKDKIRQLIAECQAVSEFAKEVGLYFSPELHGFTIADLRLAADIYGGEIQYCDSAVDPFHYFEVGEVTLYA